MKHLKMFGLAAMAAMALLGLVAASASATALYSGATKLGAGTEIKSSLTGTATLTTTEGTVLDTCAGGEVNGKTSNAGGAAETVKGKVEKTGVTWSSCTFTTDTLEGGELEIHWTSLLKGLLKGIRFKVTINTGIFGSCVFTLGTGTTLGELTGSTTTNAVMDINAVATRESGLCPSTAKWVGTYKVTSPSPLHVTAS
jgi:hypothetical protein